MSEKKELIEYRNSLPIASENIGEGDEKEAIQLYGSARSNEILCVFGALWRFAALSAAFAAIFLLFYILIFDDRNVIADYESMLTTQGVDTYAEVETTACDLEVSVLETIQLPLVIDEARSNIDIEDYMNEERNWHNNLEMSGEIKVLIIHAHSSEKVSEGMTVLDAGEALVELLNSSGVKAVHCVSSHDENGKIGSYNRMKTTIQEYKDKYPGLVLVIDVHGSERDKPFLFDIGVSSDYAWKENLRFVSSIYAQTDRNDCVVRLLPQNLGQNNGLLTVNVSMGYESAGDLVAREIIADLALGISLLFIKNAPE